METIKFLARSLSIAGFAYRGSVETPEASMRSELTRRTALLGSLASCAGTLIAPRYARAATWPERTIKVIVGGAAGSVPDSLARLAADSLSKELGRPVI